jgi:RNA polymerase sigma factor (sigma-70 family)
MDERRARFEALFGAYGRDIVGFCNWRCATPADAQDAAADVFLTAWRRLDELPEGDAGRVWLYATARKVIANQRRSHRRRTALRERLEREAPREQPAPSGEMDLVHEALLRLPARDREVLLLAEWEGLSPSEIATVVGCLGVTARGRLHRAKRRFRAVFEQLSKPDERPVRGVQPLRSQGGS